MSRSRRKVRQYATIFEVLGEDQETIETVGTPAQVIEPHAHSVAAVVDASRRWFICSYCRPRRMIPDFNVRS